MNSAGSYGIGEVIQRLVTERYARLTLVLTTLVMAGMLDYPGYQSEWEFMAKHGVSQPVIRGVYANVFRARMNRPDMQAKSSEETRAEGDRFIARDPETLTEEEYQTGLETLQRLIVRDLTPAV